MNSKETRAKDTFFSRKGSLNCNGNLLTICKPLLMGILNITPDSFYDGGNYIEEENWISQTRKMLSEGADIIDIGAVSTRPGSIDISEEEELQRLIPVIQSLKKEFPDIIISVDTYRSNVARQVVKEGASIINDISAGTFDEQMIQTIVELNVPYIIMHIKGTPENMQQNPVYEDIIKEIILFLSIQINKCKKAGINDLIIDPGFGFGKTVEHNYQILKNLEMFKIFELPILVGISRKSMINKILEIKPNDALNGTTSLNTIALMKGADILRVHDLKQASETIKIVSELQNS
ncbi:dihydropteroate synthase [Bacteroidota bacterium]